MTKQQFQEIADRWKEKLEKYKYPLLIFLVGVVLMTFPKKETDKNDVPELQITEQKQENLEIRLSELLSQVEGAGAVQVILTLETGTVFEYQTDLQTKTDADSVQQEKKTVLAASGSGMQQAVITKTIYPVYKGAVVVCEGADRPSVKLAVVQAVSSLTGLGSDRVTVIKMK